MLTYLSKRKNNRHQERLPNSSVHSNSHINPKAGRFYVTKSQFSQTDCKNNLQTEHTSNDQVLYKLIFEGYIIRKLLQKAS